jgi:hypothetical protein
MRQISGTHLGAALKSGKEGKKGFTRLHFDGRFFCGYLSGKRMKLNAGRKKD